MVQFVEIMGLVQLVVPSYFTYKSKFSLVKSYFSFIYFYALVIYVPSMWSHIVPIIFFCMQKMTKRKRAALKYLKAINESSTSKDNATDKDIRVDSDICIEDNSQEIGNQAIQMEVNSENNDARIQDSVFEVDEDTMHVEENIEVDVNERTTQDANTNMVVKRKGRGPTKVKRLPINPLSRIEVEFNADGKPIEDGSVKLSSYLGPLVREHVPVTLDKWKQLSDTLQVVLSESIEVSAAVAVWVDNPIIEDAFLWRPTKGLTLVGEAVGIKVAWPESKVVIETVNTASTGNQTINVGVVEKVNLFIIDSIIFSSYKLLKHIIK